MSDGDELREWSRMMLILYVIELYSIDLDTIARLLIHILTFRYR